MRRHDFGYFIHEGVSNLFSHGFMSFAAIGITVACLLIMGTFTLVAYNAEMLLETLESEYEILAFVDETFNETQTQQVGEKLRQLPNVKSVEFITREEAMEAFEERSLDEYMRNNITPNMFRDRYAVFVEDLNLVRQTAEDVEAVDGIGPGSVRVDEDIAGGFILVRNVAGAVSFALIVILLVVSVFIIANTIRLTTFDRRDEIAIMKMVGATNSFIRLPFIIEGLVLGVLGGGLAFLAEWGLYGLLASRLMGTLAGSFISIIPFKAVAIPMLAAYLGIGVFVGVFGGVNAIRNYLKV